MYIIKTFFLPFFQSLLQSNISAAFLNTQLSEIEWSVSDVANFLSKASEQLKPAGSAYTWRDVFNETDRAIRTISQFMEVSVSLTCSGEVTLQGFYH